METELTTREYWEGYYKHDHSGRKHIVTVCSKYDLFWNTLITHDSKKQTIIEIGGYPGRYLAYLADKYQLKPTCLDFNSDASQLQKTFASMGVFDYHLLEADFNIHTTKQQYDYVISLGFIEHFENFDTVLDKHLDYLKPGGRLLVMVPNKRYLRKFYGYLVDYKNLKAHNLKCMNFNTFKGFAKRNNLKILRLEYHGGFPFGVHQKLNIFQKFIFKSTRIIFKYVINPYLEKHPTKYLSATLVAVYEKPKESD
ncbi:class I SAM-dependent methyltransferase [Hanstruepera ponticola]|uniref:class I SAM-dependent methyltransferase n=1 Tax=Hanstruepera ponticola TaxID=2042995 RepID=UPI000CF0EAAE|nr:class I SAM-dependent methyltransferase [Hanstruepera ponticola]